MMCTSDSGYVEYVKWALGGNHEQNDIYNLIISMIQLVPYQPFHLFMDKYFSTTRIVRFLTNLGINVTCAIKRFTGGKICLSK